MKNRLLSIKNLNKKFKNNKDITKVLENITFDVFEGEIISIIGPSGCGKSTILNIISNLIDPEEESIMYNFDKKNIGYMMQSDALFPWLNIEKNAKLGCDIKQINNYDYIDKLLKEFKLYDFKNKFPNALSGGMKQRVSLIRTISTKPKLLLLDEPFASLDYQSRLTISNDIYKLIKENNISAIIITHDISEAISMSDRVIVLTKRPAKIKNIYKIDLYEKKEPIDNRKDKYFNNYYELILKDLDLF